MELSHHSMTFCCLLFKFDRSEMSRIFVHGECYIEELAYSIEERSSMVFSEK